ncbi:MAG: hypothetical protein ACHQUB_01460 [Candidatus Saccharimonadia bacterium]
MAKLESAFAELGMAMMSEDKNVSVSQMFGMPTLMYGTKAFAGLLEAGMVFKLTGDARVAALAMSGSKPFMPMPGRAMKEWIVIDATHQASWPDFARAAKAYVALLS